MIKTTEFFFRNLKVDVQLTQERKEWFISRRRKRALKFNKDLSNLQTAMTVYVYPRDPNVSSFTLVRVPKIAPATNKRR